MKPTSILSVCLMALALSFSLISCEKDKEADPFFEPIAITVPDSAWIKGRANQEIPLKARFTVEKPIDEISIRAHRDSTGAGFDPFSTDSVFYARFDTIFPRINLYDLESVYKVPADVKVGDVIRLQFKVRADTLERTKLMRIDVRL
jgi:hypothetical protein